VTTHVRTESELRRASFNSSNVAEQPFGNCLFPRPVDALNAKQWERMVQ